MIKQVRYNSVVMDTSGEPNTAIVSFEVLTNNNHTLLEESLVTRTSFNGLTRDEIIELAWTKIESRVEQRSDLVDSQSYASLQSDREHLRNIEFKVDPEVRSLLDSFGDWHFLDNPDTFRKLNPVTADYVRSRIKV